MTLTHAWTTFIPNYTTGALLRGNRQLQAEKAGHLRQFLEMDIKRGQIS